MAKAQRRVPPSPGELEVLKRFGAAAKGKKADVLDAADESRAALEAAKPKGAASPAGGPNSSLLHEAILAIEEFTQLSDP